MSARSEREMLAEVILRAWQDSAYRTGLLANPTTTLREAGMEVPAGFRVTVLEDTPTVRHVSVPPLDGADAIGRDAFLSTLAPRVPLPAGVELRLHQDTDREAFVVLPLPPPEVGQLNDESLQSVTGGGNGGNGGIGWPLGGTGGNGGNGGAG